MSGGSLRMGKPQPKLTAAIVLVLVLAASAAYWIAFTTTPMPRAGHRPPPVEAQIYTTALTADRIDRLVGMQPEEAARAVAALGLEPDGEHRFARQVRLPESPHVIDEVVRFERFDTETGAVAEVYYLRMTDAPVDEQYVEQWFP